MTDSIEDTLNYKRVAKRVLAFVEGSQFHLVETLAEHIAMLILEEFGIAWVKIVLSKPGAVRNSRDVGVALERDRSHLERLARPAAGDRHPRPMPADVLLDRPLSWRQIGAVAEGASLSLVPGRPQPHRGGAPAGAIDRRARNSRLRREYRRRRALRCHRDARPSNAQLSRNIVMSHAVGVGPALEAPAVRAIIAAAINNFAHGYSGVRAEVVERLLCIAARDCIPEVPAHGSVGYLAHMAHIALVLIGAGTPRIHGERRSGARGAAGRGSRAAVLEAKEGLSLVNGTPCVTGLTALALDARRAIAGLGGPDRRDELREFARPAVGVRTPRP